MTLAAIGYIRVSKAREEMISPDLQRAAISRWAKDNGRRIVLWLEDLDESGRGFAKRKIGQGIAAVEAGTATEILVYRYDRWGRNAADSLANIRRAELAGGKVVSTTEPFDAETAIGKYTRTNALALAEMQSDIIGEGWRAALEHRKARGLPHHGGGRFGYSYSARKHGGDGTYTVDPTTGPVLAELYRQAAAGHSTYALARWLDSLGHRPPRARAWSDRTVRAVLDSGFGAGYICEGRPPRYLPGAHDAVIDQGTWAAYRALRADVGARPIRARMAAHRMTGLLVCGHCGGPCSHTSNRGGVTGRTVACVRHRNTGTCVPLATTRLAMEEQVRSWLAEQTAGKDSQWQREQDRAAKAAAVVADTTALLTERAAVQRALARALDAYVRELADEASYLTLKAELTGRLAEIDNAIVANTADPAPEPAVFATALDAWENLPPHLANTALRHLVAAAIVRRDGIRVLGTWQVR